MKQYVENQQSGLPSELSEKLFEANAGPLAARFPALASAIWHSPVAAVGAAQNGELTCKVLVDGTERLVHSAYEPSKEAEAQAELVPDTAKSVLCVGGGLGYLPVALLRRPEIKVVLVEPQLPFLRAMLSLFDLRAALNEGRLVLMTASDLDISTLAEFAFPEEEVSHPVLGRLYAEPQRHFRYLTHLHGSRGRVLVVDNKLFVSDVAQVFEKRGFAVRIMKPEEVTLHSFQEAVRTVKPDFMFGINYSPELALLCSKVDLPYVSWTIDPIPERRMRLLPGTNTDLCIAFVHRRVLVEKLKRAGMREVLYMPLAAPLKKRRAIADPQEFAPYRCTVSFVGSALSVDQEALMRWLRHLGGDDALEERMSDYVRQTFENHGRDVSYCGLAEDGSDLPEWLLKGLPAEVDLVEASDRINGALSHHLRIDRAGACAAHDIHIYGDEGWESCGELYRGRAEHGEELTKIYNASLINLDIPRIYQRDIITMRVFDVLLCGGLLLTEPTSELLDVFTVGTHILTYDDEASLLSIIEEMNRDPERAQAIGEAGRKCVEAAHTMSHRVDTIFEELAARGLGGEAIRDLVQ